MTPILLPQHPTLRPISRQEAPGLAEGAYARFADLLETVRHDQWGLPTDCEGWSVRDLAGHMVGAMRSAASLREQLRQQREIARRVKRGGGNVVDVMTALQIELTADLSPGELVAECRDLVGPAARGRAKVPAPMRRFVTFPVEFGREPAEPETWRLGYLVDTILTRDAFLHAIDLARALGVAPVLAPTLEGRIIADVALEWGARHGQPVTLRLTGPVAGEHRFGDAPDAAVLELDAVEFCRVVSGRAKGQGLLAVDVPF